MTRTKTKNKIYQNLDVLVPEYVDTYTLRSMCGYIESVAKLKRITFQEAEQKWKNWAGVQHLSSLTPKQAQSIIYRCKQVLGILPPD
jgi:hypothetical protein